MSYNQDNNKMYLCCITSDIMYNVHCAYYVLCIDCKDTEANHKNMYLCQKNIYFTLRITPIFVHYNIRQFKAR